MEHAEFVFLGTGTSHGIPVVGCSCSVCQSTDPRNQRTRPSVALLTDGGNVLIDTTPELRIQLLRERIGRIHAVLYTHGHADHVHGFDDLRVFPRYLGGPLPIYCDDHVARRLKHSFSYAFEQKASSLPDGSIPKVHLVRIEPGRFFEVCGLRVLPIPLMHGRHPILGFRFGGIAYCTDVSYIPPESLEMLRGLDVLVLDALRYDPHPTHFSVEQALEVVQELSPRMTYFTHMCHHIDHAELEDRLPPHVRLAYDGLRLDVSGILQSWGPSPVTHRNDR